MTSKALLPWGQKFDFTRRNRSGHRLHSNVDKAAGVDLEKRLRWGLQLSSSTCPACTRPRSPSRAPHIHKMVKMTTLITVERNSAYLLPTVAKVTGCQVTLGLQVCPVFPSISSRSTFPTPRVRQMEAQHIFSGCQREIRSGQWRKGRKKEQKIKR